MLAFLEIPKSNYYRWRNKPDDETEKELTEYIKAICSKHKRRYGYRRVTQALRDDYQQKINHKRVSRIMAENNLQARIRRRRFVYFKPDVIVKKADLIQRQFKADAPNRKWFTDVSTLTFGETKLYLSAIIDGFNNEIISSIIGPSPNLELAFETINQAIQGRNIDNVILHSDQGGLYTSPKFQEFVKEKNIIQSMSQVGVCYDNVLIESLFSHLKTKAFYSQDFTATNEQILKIVEEYIYYYNNERLQLKLNKLPPIKYREQLHTA
jgi:transposase InsO family protein